MRIGFGILSWHGYDSLALALESYRREDLFGLFDETLLFLPEITPEGIDLARRFGVPAQGNAQNLGILGGFKALASAMSADILLLAENDYPLIESRAEAARQIAIAVHHLAEERAHVWRFRHRIHPGQRFQIDKAERFWPRAAATLPARAMAQARRLARPLKARRLAGWTAMIRDDADRQFPHLVRRTADGDLLVSSRCLPWANNVFMVRRDFFLGTIIPAAEAAVGGRLVNGFPSIETELNRGFWRRGNFWIGVGRGLFTHERQNDRGY